MSDSISIRCRPIILYEEVLLLTQQQTNALSIDNIPHHFGMVCWTMTHSKLSKKRYFINCIFIYSIPDGIKSAYFRVCNFKFEWTCIFLCSRIPYSAVIVVCWCVACRAFVCHHQQKSPTYYILLTNAEKNAIHLVQQIEKKCNLFIHSQVKTWAITIFKKPSTFNWFTAMRVKFTLTSSNRMKYNNIKLIRRIITILPFFFLCLDWNSVAYAELLNFITPARR